MDGRRGPLDDQFPAPTAASTARARINVDLLICPRCGGFLGDSPQDRDRSCICYNAEHARMIRSQAREYQNKIRKHG